MLYEPKNIDERVKALEEFLMGLEDPNKPPTKLKVYHYNAEGFRIAEISYSWHHSKGCSGASFMRCDIASAAVILAAEDFVILYNDEPGLLEEAKELLQYLIKGNSGTTGTS
jgi:hypothetical protein